MEGQTCGHGAPEQMWRVVGRRGVWEGLWPLLGPFSVPKILEEAVPPR